MKFCIFEWFFIWDFKLEKYTWGGNEGSLGEPSTSWGETKRCWGVTCACLGETSSLLGERVINKRTRTVKIHQKK